MKNPRGYGICTKEPRIMGNKRIKIVITLLIVIIAYHNMSILSRIKATIGKTYNRAGGIIDRLGGSHTIEVNNPPPSKYSDQDLEEVHAVTFGESSPWGSPELEPEMRAMISSGIKRAEILKQPLSAVLAIPKQFQAYGGPQYRKAKARDTSDYGAKEKMMMLDKIIQELKDGIFKADDFTSFNKEARPDRKKIGSHYFYKESQFRSK